ncbi:MAG: DUF4830 domain-containing protein [Pygmaiobacter sp.]
MFVMTMNKNGLKKAVIALGCAALIVVCAFTVTGALGHDVRETAAVADTPVGQNKKVKNTDDMVTFLLAYGVEADLASAKVDKVKVPKVWDDSFTAFNEVIRKSGLDLSKTKGKTVEKWEFLAPNRSTATESASAILLVKSKKVVGGYIISRPSGEVSPLALVLPQTAITPTMTEAEKQSETEPTAAELTPEQLANIRAAGTAVGLTQEQIAAAAAAIETAAQQTGALPSE